jgi:hypothetical protein
MTEEAKEKIYDDKNSSDKLTVCFFASFVSYRKAIKQVMRDCVLQEYV